ncbi:retron Ec48 family effector membrane protein [Vreelandella sp. EE27]
MLNFIKNFWVSLNVGSIKGEESWYILRFCAAFILIGSSMAVFIFFITMISQRIYEQSFCLSNDCFKQFYSFFDVSFLIIEWSFKASIGLFALGSFGLACKNYMHNKNANAFSSHIAYLSLFQNYLDIEVGKRIRVNRSSIDALHWYNIIYPNSSFGDIKPSEEYMRLLGEINGCILKSNEEFMGPSYKHYDYNIHQQRLISNLSNIGIYLEPLPRANFWSVEEEVVSLIEVINTSFCRLGTTFEKFSKPTYR